MRSVEERQAATKSVPVKFTDDEMNVETHPTGHDYGTVKRMVNDNREATKNMRRVALLRRNLERLPLPEIPKLEADATDEQKAAVAAAKQARDEIVTQREPVEEEIEALETKAFAVVEIMIDWFVGDETHPPAVADWDYFLDAAKTKKVPITRESLEALLPAEILAIGTALFGAMNVQE